MEGIPKKKREKRRISLSTLADSLLRKFFMNKFVGCGRRENQRRKELAVAGSRMARWPGVLFVTMFFLSPSLRAQTLDTAAVRGRVVDQTGAAVAGAEVVISNPLIGLKRATRTDGSGYYAMAVLSLTGEYKLVVSKTGFASKELEGIGLRAGEAATFNVTLTPAGVHSEITVFGTTEGIRSDSPQFFGRKITNLVLLNSAVRPARGTGDPSLPTHCSSSTAAVAAKRRSA